MARIPCFAGPDFCPRRAPRKPCASAGPPQAGTPPNHRATRRAAYATLTTAAMYQQTSVRTAAVDQVFSPAGRTHRKLNATAAGLALADIDLLSSRWTDFAATF